MGWTSLTMNVPPGTAPVPGATCETEVIGQMSLGGSTRRTVVEAEPCDCQYCRSVVGAARPRNISPLAAIDVYSLPDETDVLRAPDRSH
jgi:hypothetical protein